MSASHWSSGTEHDRTARWQVLAALRAAPARPCIGCGIARPVSAGVGSVIDRPETEVGRRRFRWKSVIYGTFALGIAGLFVGTSVGYDLAGAVVYFLGVTAGAGLCLYACTVGSLTFRDERTAAIERRASHYTIAGLAYLGLAIFPALFVLEAAGRFTFGPTLEAVLYGFSGLFIVWGAVFTVLRLRG